jgi:nucleoside-diphosphate-sugar epimerase
MNNSTQELHVIFGTGPLGKSTALELHALGHQVRMINRSGQTTDLPASIEILKGDAYNLEFTHLVTQGASSVYQCAQPAYHQWAGNFPKMQAGILEAAASNNAKLIIADNLYMYGASDGQALHETNASSTHTKKGLIRAEMARTALEAHQNGRVRVALVRGSNFFGPEDTVMSNLLFKPALQGKPMNLLGRLDQLHTFTYAPDFGRALAKIGTVNASFETQTYGRAWHVPSPEAVTQAQLVQLIETELGCKVKTRVAGAFILNVLGLFNPSMREAVEMLYEWNQPFIMDSSDFQNTFGIKPTSLEIAIKETLAWNRNQISSPAQLART